MRMAFPWKKCPGGRSAYLSLKTQWYLKCLLWLCQWAGPKSVKKERTVQFTVPCRRNPILFLILPLVISWLLVPVWKLHSDFMLGLSVCRNRKQSPFQSPQQLTAGQMGDVRVWALRALTFLLVPTTTCHGFDCQSVTCMVIQGLGQASDRAVIEGWMSVPPRKSPNCSDTFFAPTFEIRSLEK